MNGFELFRLGRIREAIEAYSAELEAEPAVLTVANRGLARMSVGDYQGALTDYRVADQMQVHETGERGDAYLKRIGTSLWLMGRYDEAVVVWRETVRGLQSGKLVFTDSAGGVQCGALLWFGSTILRDQVAKRESSVFIQNLISKAAIRNWPGPIAKYLLRQIDYSTLMQLAQQQATLALRRGCQAVFYAGIRARMDDDMEMSGRLLKMAVDYGEDAALEIEYFLAAHELTKYVMGENS